MVDLSLLTIGAAEVDITPPVGALMAGYAARNAPSQGIHDSLKCQALYIQDDKERLVLLTADLCAVDLDFTNRLRKSIEESVGLLPYQVMIACSHTHSGPQGFLPDLPIMKRIPDPELQTSVIREMTGAVRWAIQKKKSGKLLMAEGQAVGIGLNRNNPIQGPADSQVIILRADDERGQPIAVFFNFGCHPTVMGGDNLFFTADFPGAARASLQKLYPDTVFLFSNGAAGDVSTRFTRRAQGFQEVERMGNILAGSVLQAMQMSRPLENPSLNLQLIPISLPYRNLPDHQQAMLEVTKLEAELAQLNASNAQSGEIRKASTRLEGARGQLNLIKEFQNSSYASTEIHVIQIDDLQLVGIPGEIFTRTVLNIKETQKPGLTAVVSYANDYLGYFPDDAAIAMGTYEALMSPFDSEAANLIQDTSIKQLQ